MLEKIIDYSIKNRFLIILATVFILLWGVYSLANMPLDAIPDLSDVQVIVYTKYPGQAPQVVEDQITYPLTTAMLSVPGSTVVRGYSFFGFSFVYILFKDGTDLYWARSRVLEYLNYVSGLLPKGVNPSLGPDATGVGWVYEYALVDRTGKYDLAQLRSMQDWYLRYELTSVEGVSEVASVGGFVKQYQVDVDPNKLLAYNIPLSKVKRAIKRSNQDVGGRLLEISEIEYMVRGLGYIKGVEDIKNIAIGVDNNGTPILVRDVANVHLGPELRRGVTELNGEGEVAGGVVLMRFGGNALATINRVKEKLKSLKAGLPKGVEIVPVYDRSNLINNAISTLKEKLIEESIVVALVCIIFLLHFRSAFVAIFTLPVGILMALTIMNFQGLNANIMSLGGIAIAIGAMIDAAIVMIENAHKQMEKDSGTKDHWVTIGIAAKQVGPALFFSLLIITFSFLPIFTLQAQEGRLFRPLAFTKTYSMASAALLAVTLVPVMMGYFIKTTLLPELWSRKKQRLVSVGVSALVFLVFWLVSTLFPMSVLSTFGVSIAIFMGALTLFLLWPQAVSPEFRNPVNRFLIWVYKPVIHWVLYHKAVTMVLAVLVVLTLMPFHSMIVEKLPEGPVRTFAMKMDRFFPLDKIGGEFMPPLYEGDLLYMPSTFPGISITKARELLQQTDKIIKSFPEVKRVFGKIGRADTATDPAPLSMIETTIMLKPQEEWREVPVERFFSGWPGLIRSPLADIWPEKRAITPKELISEMNKALQFPGITNAWTMPIKTRIDMLATGIKTPVGIKIMGANLNTLAMLGKKIEAVVRQIPGTLSVYSERVVGGYYLDYNIDRKAAARYGLTVGDIQDVIQSAVGGMNVTETVEGLERYPVNLRYGRELRDSIPKLKRILIATPTGAQIPIAQVAKISVSQGPPVIKSENSRMSAWIYVDLAGIDIATYVKNAKKIIARDVDLPSGYNIVWSGQYEYMERANKRLAVVVPITLLVIFLLLYFNFRNVSEAIIVMLSLPFAIVGGIWFIYLLGYNMSIAVGVGFIALAGVSAEIGVLVLIYIDHAYEERLLAGRMNTKEDLYAAFIEGTSERVRPIMMTVTAVIAGLLPLFWGHGAGADTMRRIAAPMIGGMVSSTILTLIVIPVIYAAVKSRSLGRNKKEVRDA
ncbi:Cobalt-zinc-cadmium resistance protein CzcA; Cation efflux system protein CusA [hydrothermal vent metagenome]|uniref:Cobalt-zinc-cadmium resistance protein CzcA Cation efflux system protein CusA n=1 Tax=hydrothermal vent metagenome TaxID=652676 RepID=A0A3B1D599_9ZZZZ